MNTIQQRVALPARPSPWTDRWSGVATTLAVGGGLAAAWGAVYVGGGTTSALPHAFYLPIVAAGVRFGRIAGLTVAATATVLCGPLMPLDVASGQPQLTAAWLIRGVFFVLIGLLAGAQSERVHRRYEHETSRHLRAELTPDGEQTARPGDYERIVNVLLQRAFHPVFQPIYSLDDDRLIAVEALTRFDMEPHRGPDEWFAEAAAVGLGRELELAAIEAALQASQGLLDLGVEVTVNASPEAMCDPRLLELFDRHAARPVVLEITEHRVIDDYRQLDKAILDLRQRGIRIAVDDAGAGFASLRHILRLNPDVIKLDHSLTHNVRSDPLRRALAKALVNFGEETGRLIIAEGIEHPADLRAWRQLGAHAAQGYLFGEPAPLPTVLASTSSRR